MNDAPPSKYTSELDPKFQNDAKRAIRANQVSLEASAGNQELKVGDYVNHEIMGRGVILSVDTTKSAYIVKFDDLPTERRISFKARLEKIEH